MAVIEKQAIRVETMTPLQFAAVQDNPRQRDTERHAAKLIKHVTHDSPTLHVVAVADVFGVGMVKLDGHTRCYLWRHGKLPSPRQLIVLVYECYDMDEAKELYTHFDSYVAVETTGDRVSGSLRECGLQLNSKLLSKGDFATAIKAAQGSGYNRGTEYPLIRQWRGVLAEVDDWDLPKNPMRGTGLTALAFLLVASEYYPLDKVRSFFQRYASGEGYKSGSYMDGPQALREHMHYRKENGLNSGADGIKGQMEKGISCVRAYCDDSGDDDEQKQYTGQLIRNVQPSAALLGVVRKKALERIKAGVWE